MQAARVYPKKNTFVVEDVPVPDIGPGEVLVRVHTAGMSRGLLSVWLFTDMIKLLPATLGHEIAGVVAATGPGVSAVRKGDRVHVYAPLGCQEESCAACADGNESACESFAMIGYALFMPNGMRAYERYHDGGMAEYVRVPAGNLDKLSDETSFAAGCKLATAAISWKAVTVAGATAPGGTLLVTGASGANGSLAVACAPLAGFDQVIAVAAHRDALDPLTGMFPYVTAIATEELAPDWEKKGGLTDALREAAGQVDAIVDFTPIGPAVIAQSLPVLNRHGRAVLMAGNPSLVEISYLDIMTRDLCVSGCPHATRADVRQVAGLVAGKELDLDRFVTHRFRLDAVGEAMKTIMLRKGSPALVVLDVAENGNHDQPKDELMTEVSTTTADLERNKAIVRRFVEEIINGGDLGPVVDELFHPEYLEGNYPLDGHTGPEIVRTWVPYLRWVYPDVRHEILDLCADGDTVMCRSIQTGTPRGFFEGKSKNVPAYQRSQRRMEINMLRLKDGKICEHWGPFSRRLDDHDGEEGLGAGMAKAHQAWAAQDSSITTSETAAPETSVANGHAAEHPSVSEGESRMDTPQAVFNDMASTLAANPDRTEGLTATYQYNVEGEHGGWWTLIIDDGTSELRNGKAENPDVKISIDETDLLAMANGEFSGTEAFMTGKLRVEGNPVLGMQLGRILG